MLPWTAAAQEKAGLPGPLALPAAAALQSVDASYSADKINPLKYEKDPELTAEKWNEPKTSDQNKSGSIRYAAKYPYNHVFESESGHIKEYDDTPGSERIHEYHTAGTFYEIDADGTKNGYDTLLTKSIVENASIPVIASGGCGKPGDMVEIFEKSNVDAALAASIFHYDSHGVQGVKSFLKDKKIPVRL